MCLRLWVQGGRDPAIGSAGGLPQAGPRSPRNVFMVSCLASKAAACLAMPMLESQETTCLISSADEGFRGSDVLLLLGAAPAACVRNEQV